MRLKLTRRTRCIGCARGMPLLPKGSSYHTTREQRPEHFNGSNQMLCVHKPHYRLIYARN